MASRLKSNPTISTVAKVQRVLETAQGPLTRYQIHRKLHGSVNYPVIDAIIRYFDTLSLVYDEGPRGHVLWIHNTSPVMRELVRKSRRVA